MDWIKKNTALVVGIVVAVIAMGGAGYYLYASMGKSTEATALLDSAVQRRNALVQKRPNHPGFEKVDNIKRTKQDHARLLDFKSELSRGFKATTPVEPTERGFKRALAAVMEEIEAEGERSGLTVPTNFNLSFTAQKISYKFASNSLGPLSIQLADLSEVARILVDARVNSIESFKRVKVSEDDSDENAVEDEYITNFAITTNEETQAVIYPYEVSFRCFSDELGDVLEGIAASPYSILVKTIAVEPAAIRNATAKLASAASLYEGLYPVRPPDPTLGQGGDEEAGRYGGGRAGAFRGRREGRGEGAMTSRYGGAGGSRPRAGQRAPVPGAPPGFAPPQPVQFGPELLLQPEPLRVNLGLAMVRMPEPETDEAAKN